jgi:hypothetical protein
MNTEDGFAEWLADTILLAEPGTVTAVDRIGDADDPTRTLGLAVHLRDGPTFQVTIALKE